VDQAGGAANAVPLCSTAFAAPPAWSIQGRIKMIKYNWKQTSQKILDTTLGGIIANSKMVICLDVINLPSNHQLASSSLVRSFELHVNFLST